MYWQEDLPKGHQHLQLESVLLAPPFSVNLQVANLLVVARLSRCSTKPKFLMETIILYAQQISLRDKIHNGALQKTINITIIRSTKIVWVKLIRVIWQAPSPKKKQPKSYRCLKLWNLTCAALAWATTCQCKNVRNLWLTRKLKSKIRLSIFRIRHCSNTLTTSKPDQTLFKWKIYQRLKKETIQGMFIIDFEL